MPNWLDAEVEMTERVRAFDWGSTPFGSIDTWPEQLKAASASAFSAARRRVVEEKSLSAALREVMAEKEELARESQHRLRNSLQVIVSLLNMQARHIRDDRTLQLFQESRNRVRAIAGVYEVMDWATSSATVALATYTRQLVPELLQFYGLDQHLHVEITGDSATLELERAVPCAILLNELVSNACKHAFTGRSGGELDITFTRDADAIEMTVQDDGPGLPAGLDHRRAASFGYKLVTGLVAQLGGTWSAESNGGTSIKVRFPNPPGVRARA